MLDLYNVQFGQLLHIAASTRYTPTESERALVYRVLSASYNPLGVYYALAGGVLAYRLGSVAPRTPRLTATLLCALYANEASWLLHEPYPTQAFFRDVVVVRGELGALAGESAFVLPFLGFALRATVLQQLLSTLTLRHTRQSMLACVTRRHHSSERERWLAMAGEQWLPYEDMDPLTYLYWTSKRARRRWSTYAA